MVFAFELVSKVLLLSLCRRCCRLSTPVSQLTNPDREISLAPKTAAAQFLCSHPTPLLTTCRRPTRVLLESTHLPAVRACYSDHLRAHRLLV
ncbi:hypothetical protein M758_UG126700 [Ceratodon purpureus]|nr:hypothetical protein M758_UG126700 [Ceratodon purpureus]